jgi:hypothetical protein
MFRYPSQPTQVPPGQHHESPTEQYWNTLPNEQATFMSGNNHVNVASYTSNCNFNSNLGANGDFDGTEMIADETQ